MITKIWKVEVDKVKLVGYSGNKFRVEIKYWAIFYIPYSGKFLRVLNFREK